MAHTKNGDASSITGGDYSGGGNAPSKRSQHRIGNFDTSPKPIPGYAGETTVGGGSGHGGGGGGGMDTSSPRPTKPPGPSGTGIDLRQLFTGATLKKIIGLPHVLADVVLAKIGAPQGGQVYGVAKDRSDVYVGFQDIISNIFGIGRLFAPGNMLWRLPKKGQSAMVLKPSEADGTGIPYVLYGDGGYANAVPYFLDGDNSGTYVVENWHTEAGGFIRLKANVTSGGEASNTTCSIDLKADGTIEISGGIGTNVTLSANGGGNVVVNGGVLNVARVSDQVQGMAGPYPIVNGVISGPGAPNFKA